MNYDHLIYNNMNFMNNVLEGTEWSEIFDSYLKRLVRNSFRIQKFLFLTLCNIQTINKTNKSLS